MANKTVPTTASVRDVLDRVQPALRRADGWALHALMGDITGEEPVMWGESLVGYGQYHYRYESGREGDSFRVGFSPRKANLVVYVMPGFDDYAPLLARLGKHKIGSCCLYLTRLANVDEDVLRELITRAWDHMAARYPSI